MMVGSNVRFIPTFIKEERCSGLDNSVLAKVIYINQEHDFFVAEWVKNGHILREGWKFCDLGQRVKVYGRKQSKRR